MGKHLSASLGGVIAALLTACAATAHEWYDGWCCHDRDCAPLPVGAVTMIDGGYSITLQAGEHPMVREATTLFVPHDSKGILPSQDGQYHACIVTTEYWDGTGTGSSVRATARCIYVPPGF